MTHKIVYTNEDKEPDYDHWAKMPGWTLREAIALIQKRVLRQSNIFDDESHKIEELAYRARDMGQLSDPVLPIVFLSWAKQKNIPIPEKLATKVHHSLSQEVDLLSLIREMDELKAHVEKNASLEKSLSARERQTLYKMIIGMAKDAYGYDSKVSRSPFPKELEGILDGLGISVSDDTVRDKLKEASEFLPQDVNADRN